MNKEKGTTVVDDYVSNYWNMVTSLRRHLSVEGDYGPDKEIPDHMKSIESYASKWGVSLDDAAHYIWVQDTEETVPYDMMTELDWQYAIDSKDLWFPDLYNIRQEFIGTKYMVPVSKILMEIEEWANENYYEGDNEDRSVYGKWKYDYYSFHTYNIPEELSDKLYAIEDKIILHGKKIGQKKRKKRGHRWN